MEKIYKIKYTGIAPLLMHSLNGMDPLNPLVKEASAINALHHTKKTEEHKIRLLEIDYLLGAYYDKEIGMYIPAEVIEANIRDGAKASKNGKKAVIGLFVDQERIKLIHDGPQEIEKLYLESEFRDTRAVTIGTSKILRCRPRFNRWSLEFTLSLNTALMSEDELKAALDIASIQKGIGDYRPRYGRFEYTIEAIN